MLADNPSSMLRCLNFAAAVAGLIMASDSSTAVNSDLARHPISRCALRLLIGGGLVFVSGEVCIRAHTGTAECIVCLAQFLEGQLRLFLGLGIGMAGGDVLQRLGDLLH